MAANSRKTKTKRRARLHKMGRKRKDIQSRASTLSYDELFAACGEPGQPAPAPTSK
ncbi:MAG: hypothetical protein KAI47_19145 [Deltaproteobacteria bacterium]|nr:hypothetical protein [Deltaproteobacteria bacterium]